MNKRNSIIILLILILNAFYFTDSLNRLYYEESDTTITKELNQEFQQDIRVITVNKVSFGNSITPSVIDTTQPTISSPPDLHYEANDGRSHLITWDVFDANPSHFNIYINNSIIINNATWVSNTIVFNTTGAAIGYYEINLTLFDVNNNTASDIVGVNIIKGSPPVINSPADIEYGLNDGSLNYINWIVADINPSNYIIQKDGVVITSGIWSNGTITANVSSLSLGTYIYTLTVNDTNGNQISDDVIVTVNNGIAPTISSPPDITFERDDGKLHWVNWTIFDTDPGNLTISMDGTILYEGNWTSGVFPVEFSFFPLGIYEITLTLYDLNNNSVSDSVIITIIKGPSPIVSSPNDFTYGAGDGLIHLLNWSVTDTNPGNYTITRDGLVVSEGFWTTGFISTDVGGLSKGVYTFEITLNDTNGNIVKDIVIVTVTTGNPPTINHPNDLTYIQHDNSLNYIYWTITDTDPGTYTVYINGIVHSTGNWDSSLLTVNVSSLDAGTYNFTLVAIDANGNVAQDTVILVVTLGSPPSISSPPDITFERGDGLLHWVNWTIYDTNPGNLTISMNGTLMYHGNWTSGVFAVEFSFFPLGTYEITLTIYDLNNNSVSDTVLITITRGPAPVVSSPNDISFEEGDGVSHSIIWGVSDSNPGNYTISQDGIVVDSGIWVSGQLSIDISHLTAGNYSFELKLNDSNGNITIDQVFVVVVEYDTNPPIISQPSDVSYEYENTGNTISWVMSDKNSGNYTIYKNNSIIESNNYLVNGTITINIDGLIVGTYNFTILIMDKNGNFATDTVIVTVTQIIQSNPSSNSSSTQNNESSSNEDDNGSFSGLPGFNIFISALTLFAFIMVNRRYKTIQ
ncbi:MAG: hypothetical protein OEZ01_10105 [Candidatus Heimdallarchaeota archaeon]|nr:hypothetical protein [Candidatus Heimdallarchaeota archaeon]